MYIYFLCIFLTIFAVLHLSKFKFPHYLFKGIPSPPTDLIKLIDDRCRIILLTGGFDPIHSGHISLINDAKRLDGHLVIGLNSDEWLKRKKNYFFMPLNERIEVLQNINGVYKVISFNDDDDTAINAITKCLDMAREVIFANGEIEIKITYLS